jgi:hypothetical protein
MSWLIKPMYKPTGVTAPGMVSFSEKEEAAIADVKSRSRLSASDKWDFSRHVKKLKDNTPREKFNFKNKQDD